MFRQVFQKLILLTLLSLVSCKFTPYNGNDVYNSQANLPEDESLHYKNSLEWWYFTGQLNDINSNKIYGIEYVMFHFNPRNKKDYLMTNFAITDPETGNFRHDFKILKLDSLLQPHLPLDLVVKDKKIEHVLKGQMGKYEISANMRDSDVAMSLQTNPLKPLLLHNDTGYETYGEYTKAGYYSYPRLQTSGHLQIGKESMEVEGELWYDRQWNCVGVWQKDVAWDWISVQLDEPQSELMLYRLHHFGDDQVLFGGSYFTEDNENITFGQGDIQLEELEYWTSKKSKAKYPVKWKVKIDKLDLELIIEARIPEQELGIGFTFLYTLYYWEGMCSVKGEMRGQPITGKSYIELTNRDAFNK